MGVRTHQRYLFPNPNLPLHLKFLTFHTHPQLLSPPETLSFSKWPKDTDTEDQGLRLCGTGRDARPGPLATEANRMPRSWGRWQRRKEKWEERENKGMEGNGGKPKDIGPGDRLRRGKNSGVWEGERGQGWEGRRGQNEKQNRGDRA